MRKSPKEPKAEGQEILPPLPAPSAWQHAPHDEPDADDEREVFRSELPPDLLFTPVPRRTRRKGGFTPQRQRAFILNLAACGSVTKAAKAIGTSRHAISKLRNAAGAESFDAAWGNAARRGAKQILDVMIENAVHGTPEYLYQKGELVAERRRFSTRAQMWLVAHYLPDQFAVPGGLMHQQGSSISTARLKKQWEEEWRKEHLTAASEEEAAEAVLKKLTVLRKRIWYQQYVPWLDDADKRAAAELLYGAQDWERIRELHERDLGSGGAEVDLDAEEGPWGG